MKKILLTIASLLAVSYAIAQEKGDTATKAISHLYLTLEDSNNKNAAYSNAVIIRQANKSKKAPLRATYTTEEVFGNGIKKFGNIIKESWGIAFEDTLYINKRLFTGMNGFAKAHTSGRYIVVFAEVPLNKQMQDSLVIPTSIINEHVKAQQAKSGVQSAGMMFGLVGAAISAAAANAAAQTVFFPLIIDTGNGRARAFSTRYISDLADEHAEAAETDRPAASFTDQDIVDYFNRINNYIAGTLVPNTEPATIEAVEISATAAAPEIETEENATPEAQKTEEAQGVNGNDETVPEA